MASAMTTHTLGIRVRPQDGENRTVPTESVGMGAVESGRRLADNESELSGWPRTRCVLWLWGHVD